MASPESNRPRLGTLVRRWAPLVAAAVVVAVVVAVAEHIRENADAHRRAQLVLVNAQEKAGDAQGAAATREAYFKVPRRGIEYVYLWKKLGGRPAARVAAKPQGE